MLPTCSFSTCVTPGISRNTHVQGEPCITTTVHVWYLFVPVSWHPFAFFTDVVLNGIFDECIPVYIYKNRNRAEHFFDNRYLSYRTRLPFHIQHQILNTSYTPRREIRSILLRYVTAGRCVTQPISAKRGNAPMAENRGRHADSSSAEQAAVPS